VIHFYSNINNTHNIHGFMRQCQVEGQDFSRLSTKVLTPLWRRLTLTSWCQNLADFHSFPSMYDMYRQQRSNAGENDDWIQKNTQFQQKFWKKNLVRLPSKQKFSKTIASNYIMSYMVGKLGFPAFS